MDRERENMTTPKAKDHIKDAAINLLAAIGLIGSVPIIDLTSDQVSRALECNSKLSAVYREIRRLAEELEEGEVSE